MKRTHIILIIVSIITLIVPFTDFNPAIKAEEGEYYAKVQKGLTFFRKVYERVQSNYVEEIDPYEFIKSGIDGMLSTLDPYTVFIEQEADARLRIITTGKYGGLGMEIGMRNNQITVISPMENSPAEKAGITAGDIIEKIDGDLVSNLSPEKISNRLRGPVGSKVKITILRPGYDGEISLDLTREEIVIEDVSYADFIQPGIAYFRLTGFTEKAYSELYKEIERLSNIHKIDYAILDLRGNSGGLLEAAVDVASIFLPKGTTVVSTRGIRDGEHFFKTTNDPILPDVPMAVMVDGGSASASEIVAGALQDLDRAIIVGTETFGKGLVQKVYNIDKDSDTKIKITTAKYYIPSGRCVQKQDYSKDNAVFFHSENDTLAISDQSPGVFYTSNNRQVYEKGGITPDRYIPGDSLDYIITELWRNSLPFNFAVKYHSDHPVWEGKFEITDHIFDEFIKYLSDQHFSYNLEGEREIVKFIETADKDNYPDKLQEQAKMLLNQLNSIKQEYLLSQKSSVKEVLFNEFAEKYFGSKDKFRYILKYDKQIEAAVQTLTDRSTYRKILAIN
jgi:carboxyl-terminal processing protease